MSCCRARVWAGGSRLSAPPAHTPASGSQIWLTALCLVLVFTVTLSVYPAITAMVTSSTSPGKWSECVGKQKRAEQGSEGEKRKRGTGTKSSPLPPPRPRPQVSSSTPSAASFSLTSWTGWDGA